MYIYRFSVISVCSLILFLVGWQFFIFQIISHFLSFSSFSFLSCYSSSTPFYLFPIICRIWSYLVYSFVMYNIQQYTMLIQYVFLLPACVIFPTCSKWTYANFRRKRSVKDDFQPWSFKDTWHRFPSFGSNIQMYSYIHTPPSPLSPRPEYYIPSINFYTF